MTLALTNVQASQAGNYTVLETSGSLSPAAWVVVSYSPIQIGDQYLLPLDMSGTNGFYRLWFPGP